MTQYYEAKTFLASVTGLDADRMTVNEFFAVLGACQKLYKEKWELMAKMNPFVKGD